MISAEDQQCDKGDGQPNAEEWIGDEQDMEGDAVMTEGFEPAGSVGVEGVYKEMSE